MILNGLAATENSYRFAVVEVQGSGAWCFFSVFIYIFILTRLFLQAGMFAFKNFSNGEF